VTPDHLRFAPWIALVGVAAVGCGMGIKRDLSGVKPPEVVFDDLCGLQEYYDAQTSPSLTAPAEVFGQGVGSGKGGEPTGGLTRFVFSSAFQIHYLRKVLSENWKRVPPELLNAERVELQVRWSQKAGVRRVVTTEDARIETSAPDKDSWYLPYHICLSELLFGEDLYRTRRTFLKLPPPAPSRFAKAHAAHQAGSPVDAGTADGRMAGAGDASVATSTSPPGAATGE
jgi:hypothetical protein